MPGLLSPALAILFSVDLFVPRLLTDRPLLSLVAVDTVEGEAPDQDNDPLESSVVAEESASHLLSTDLRAADILDGGTSCVDT